MARFGFSATSSLTRGRSGFISYFILTKIVGTQLLSTKKRRYFQPLGDSLPSGSENVNHVFRNIIPHLVFCLFEINKETITCGKW